VKLLLKKLVLGKPSPHEPPREGTISKRVRNIKAIWNNDHHDDMGIEKVVRLFLASSQFLFPGIYLKQLFAKKGIAYRDLSVDAFVLVKISLPITMLYLNLQGYNVLFYIMLWFLLETMLYVPTLIFASDLFSKPRSYRRSMLLLFFNYIEIVFSFAVIYRRGNYLNQPFHHWFDPVYYSFVTAASIGYGDYYPITPTGKFLVSMQSVIFLTFVVMFLNFFSGKVESKGYFDHTNKS
jgi:hypothetical protein